MKPVKLPAGYAPAFAVGTADSEGNFSLVDAASPLPVVTVSATIPPSVPSPLEGNTSTSMLVGPFGPAAGIAVNIVLSGSWAGTVQLQRSSDGGTTRHPVTVGGEPWAQFASNVCEPAWVETEAGIELYLDIVLT
jgi:hypothetical protein